MHKIIKDSQNCHFKVFWLDSSSGWERVVCCTVINSNSDEAVIWGKVDCVWNMTAHAQKQDFVFRAKRKSPFKSARGRQFSRLLAAEVYASAVVMLDTPCSEVVWRVLATQSIRQFPLHFISRTPPCTITFQPDSSTCILRYCFLCRNDKLARFVGLFVVYFGTLRLCIIQWYSHSWLMNSKGSNRMCRNLDTTPQFVSRSWGNCSQENRWPGRGLTHAYSERSLQPTPTRPVG